jgi:protein-disulfide isomerase
MSKKANPPPPTPVRGALALLVLGLAASALSIFQWSQLLTLRAGGSTLCGVSDRVNCDVVWNLPFASAVHGALNMPVAALGVLWGIVAVALSTLYLVWQRSGYTVRPAVNGLRLTAAAGLGASVLFAGVSASAGVLCPTCLGTYALALAFAGVAWRGLPGPVLPQSGEWGRALGWTGGFTVASYLALLGPGMATPQGTSSAPAAIASAPTGQVPLELDAYLRGLPPSELQAISNALAAWLQDTPQPARAPARRRYGPADAPVRIVEWTDSRCPHCKSLVQALALMKKRLPEGKMSLEARHFPLDSACNPSMPPRASDGGTRCTAAKAQICLEQAPDYWTLREKIFEAQSSLTVEKVLSIASSGSVSRARLEQCVMDSETTRKLHEDMEYAKQHDLHGTPLVVINGRTATALPSFIYALILAGGNGNDPAFRVLPAPQPMQAHNH